MPTGVSIGITWCLKLTRTNGEKPNRYYFAGQLDNYFITRIRFERAKFNFHYFRERSFIVIISFRYIAYILLYYYMSMCGWLLCTSYEFNNNDCAGHCVKHCVIVIIIYHYIIIFYVLWSRIVFFVICLYHYYCYDCRRTRSSHSILRSRNSLFFPSSIISRIESILYHARWGAAVLLRNYMQLIHSDSD